MEFRGMTCPFERITDVSIRSASLLPTITVCGPCMKAGISLGDAMETAAKVPLTAISKALGHKKVTTTMRYLRLGVDENAAILAGSSFFKDFEGEE